MMNVEPLRNVKFLKEELLFYYSIRNKHFLFSARRGNKRINPKERVDDGVGK
jgi:hypothetical protein